MGVSFVISTQKELGKKISEYQTKISKYQNQILSYKNQKSQCKLRICPVDLPKGEKVSKVVKTSKNSQVLTHRKKCETKKECIAKYSKMLKGLRKDLVQR